MDRALLFLLGLRLKGWLRRFGRNLRGVKGALLSLLGLVVFVPWLVSAFLATPQGNAGRLEGVRRFGPLGLVLYCVITLLLSSGERAIYFSPAEVNFLFPGPFSRRQLLGYKIVASLGLSALSAIFMTAFMSNNAAWFVAAYVGLILALMFMQLFAMSVALVTASVGELVTSWRRRVVLGLVVGLAMVAFWQVGRDALALPNLELLTRLEQAPAVQAVVTPFRWFVLAFTAERLWPDLVQWSALGLLVDLALTGLVLALDAQYLETAASTSARIYARLEQMRRGGVSPTLRRPGKRRYSLPPLPWWGGAGPIAWRQLTMASRDFGRPLILVFCFGGLAGTGMAVGGRAGDSEAPQAIAFMVPMLTLILTQTLMFDFRGDVDRIEVLKTLPIAPSRLVVGQLVAPVLMITALQWATLAALGWNAEGAGRVAWFAAAAGFALPFNVLLFEIENLMFLWFPTRLTSSNPADIQNMGRVILLMLAKVVCLGLAAGAAALAAAAVYFLAGRRWPLMLAAAWVVLAVLSVVLVPLIALAFRQFDVARDTPA